MKKAKKVVALALCAVMLVVGSVAGTLAYLTDKDAVVNTFTVGNVDITLDELNVDKKDASGNDNASVERDKANKYHLIPGCTYTKDPTVTVEAGSERCWLFVKVNNGLKGIIDTTTIEDQIVGKGWEQVRTDNNGVVYAYYAPVEKNAEDQKFVVFENFKLKGDADVSAYTDAQITVNACAVQAAELTRDAALAQAIFE